MKSVVICCFAPHEGPGYFATYLRRQSIASSIVKPFLGERLPALEAIAGLAMMGGPMSANDDLPWIDPMLRLINDCVVAHIPVIGHCLGGQLLARALGAPVTRNAVKEIGWARVAIEDKAAAGQWGPTEPFESYHWHGETFAIPARGTRIWSSEHCQNQAFVWGKHIGMQCHIEITEDMIDDWCQSGAAEIESNRFRSPAVQTPQEMRQNLTEKLEALRRVADSVYERWTRGLERESIAR
jgi:GMP synthase-like glutamine amidotransferase